MFKTEEGVTILIPTYFKEIPNISRCLDSVFKQTHKNFKILVLDENSPKEMVDILTDYKNRYPDKMDFKQTPLNVPARYNKFIKDVDTKLVYFLDADCVMRHDCLEKLMKIVKKHPEYKGYAGNVKNPQEPESKLQELIGIELESRYNTFTEEIIKAPTMNFLVKTDMVKKLKFNESLKVSYDADFSFRLNKECGKKIRYVKGAMIYHYHRATWKRYFNQQKTYATYAPITYINTPKYFTGDSLSSGSILIQPLLFYVFVAGIILSCIFPEAVFLVIVSVSWLIYLYHKSIKKIKNIETLESGDGFNIYLIHIVRTVALGVGLINGIINVVKYIFTKKL